MYESYAELSEAELKKINSDTLRLINEKREYRKSTALASLLEICQGAELTVADLKAFVKTYAAKPSVADADTPKTYANPENVEEKWDGQGRQPKWVKAQLKSGKTLEQLEVQTQQQAE